MSKRSYDQFCPLAKSLDLIGERWTLLVVRDLLSGPKRYTDLLHGLDGISTDILTERLRRLEEADLLLRRKLPAPAASTVYELTPRGEELEPALLSLARFGFPLLAEMPAPGQIPSPETFGLMLRALFDPTTTAGREEAYAFESGESRIEVLVSDGSFEVFGEGTSAPVEPAVKVRAEATAVYELMTGRVGAERALRSGAVEIEGSRAAFHRLMRAFPAPRTVAAT